MAGISPGKALKTASAAIPGAVASGWADRNGATVELGSILGTTLVVYGACFLDAAHHPGPTQALPPVEFPEDPATDSSLWRLNLS